MKTPFTKHILFIASVVGLVFIVNGCGDTTTPPEPTNDEEVITTLKIELKDSITGQLLNYYFRDLDGEGGKGPSQWDTILLSPNKTYTGLVRFLNESNPNNIIDVSTEIKNEQTDHIICYTENGTNTSISRTDSDGNFPVGFTTKWKTPGAGSGKLTITLKHQAGLKNGSCDPGETDVEVIFPLQVK